MEQLNFEKKLINETIVERVVDRLYEESYLCDLEIRDDDYTLFFQNIYNYFKEKNINKAYYEIMDRYIAMVISKKEPITISNLYDILDDLENYVSKDNIVYKMTKEDILHIKHKCTKPKKKVLHCN